MFYKSSPRSNMFLLVLTCLENTPSLYLLYKTPCGSPAHWQPCIYIYCGVNNKATSLLHFHCCVLYTVTPPCPSSTYKYETLAICMLLQMPCIMRFGDPETSPKWFLSFRGQNTDKTHANLLFHISKGSVSPTRHFPQVVVDKTAKVFWLPVI